MVTSVSGGWLGCPGMPRSGLFMHAGFPAPAPSHLRETEALPKQGLPRVALLAAADDERDLGAVVDVRSCRGVFRHDDARGDRFRGGVLDLSDCAVRPSDRPLRS